MGITVDDLQARLQEIAADLDELVEADKDDLPVTQAAVFGIGTELLDLSNEME